MLANKAFDYVTLMSMTTPYIRLAPRKIGVGGALAALEFGTDVSPTEEAVAIPSDPLSRYGGHLIMYPKNGILLSASELGTQKRYRSWASFFKDVVREVGIRHPLLLYLGLCFYIHYRA